MHINLWMTGQLATMKRTLHKHFMPSDTSERENNDSIPLA